MLKKKLTRTEKQVKRFLGFAKNRVKKLTKGLKEAQRDEKSLTKELDGLKKSKVSKTATKKSGRTVSKKISRSTRKK